MIDQRILNKGWCRPISHSLRVAVPPFPPCLCRRPGETARGQTPLAGTVPRRRDYVVGPVPNRGLTAAILWRGDSLIGNLLVDCLHRRDYSSGSVRMQESVGDQSLTARLRFGCGTSDPRGSILKYCNTLESTCGLCVGGVEFNPALVQRPSGDPDFPFGTNRSDGGLGVDRPADFE